MIRNKIVSAGLMAIMIVAIFATLINARAVETSIPENMELTVVRQPEYIPPHSIGLLIFNLTNHGEMRTVEVSIVGLPDDIKADIIPEEFNISTEATQPIYIYLRTGDTPLNASYNITIKVEDKENRAISTQQTITVSILGNEIDQLSFDMTGLPLYKAFIVRHNSKYTTAISHGTYDPYATYSVKYLQEKREDNYATSPVFAFLLPKKGYTDIEVADSINSHYTLECDEGGTNLHYTATNSPSVIIGYTFTNVGSTILKKITISTDPVSKSSSETLQQMDNDGYTYIPEQYIAVSNDGHPIGDKFGVVREGRANSTAVLNPSMSYASLNAITAYSISKAKATAPATLDTTKVQPVEKSLRTVEYTNVLPYSEIPTRALIFGGSSGFTTPSPGTTPSGTSTTNDGIINEFEAIGNHEFTSNIYDAMNNNKLVIKDNINSATQIVGKYGDKIQFQNGLIGDGNMFMGHSSEYGEVSSDGEVSLNPSDDVSKTSGQLKYNIHLLVNAKDLIAQQHTDWLSTPGDHTAIYYLLLETTLKVQGMKQDFTRKIYMMVPIVITLKVAQTPTQPTTRMATIILDSFSITTVSGLTEFTIENPEDSLDIPCHVALRAHIYNYDPNANYLKKEINLIIKTLQLTSLSDNTRALIGSLDSVNIGEEQGDGTYQPLSFDGWHITSSIDDTPISIEPDSNGQYIYDLDFHLHIQPPADAIAGDTIRFIIRATITNNNVFRSVNNIPNVNDIADETANYVDNAISKDNIQQAFNDLIQNVPLQTNTRALLEGGYISTVFSSDDFGSQVSAGSGFQPSQTAIAKTMDTILYMTIGIIALVITVAILVVALLSSPKLAMRGKRPKI